MSRAAEPGEEAGPPDGLTAAEPKQRHRSDSGGGGDEIAHSRSAHCPQRQHAHRAQRTSNQSRAGARASRSAAAGGGEARGHSESTESKTSGRRSCSGPGCVGRRFVGGDEEREAENAHAARRECGGLIERGWRAAVRAVVVGVVVMCAGGRVREGGRAVVCVCERAGSVQEQDGGREEGIKARASTKGAGAGADGRA